MTEIPKIDLSRALIELNRIGGRAKFTDYLRKLIAAWKSGPAALVEWTYDQKAPIVIGGGRQIEQWKRQQGVAGIHQAFVGACEDLRDFFEGGSYLNGIGPLTRGLAPRMVDLLAQELVEPVDLASTALINNPGNYPAPLSTLEKVLEFSRSPIDALEKFVEIPEPTPTPALASSAPVKSDVHSGEPEGKVITGAERANRLADLRNDEERAILTNLLTTGPMQVKELAEALGVNERTVGPILKGLAERGEVWRKAEKRPYFPGWPWRCR